MNITEELSKKALDYLSNIETFVSNEIPNYLTEVVEWAIAKSILLAGVFLLFTIAFIVSASIIIRKPDEKFRDYDNKYIGFWILLVAGLAFSSGVFCNLFTLVQACVAPKVYLIEYFTRLL